MTAVLIFQACTGQEERTPLFAQAATGELAAPTATVVTAGAVVSAPAAAVAATVDRLTVGNLTGTGTFKVWWDSSYLGVEVIFNDNGPARIDSTNLWDDDSIELYIDANANKGTTYDSFDRQFVRTVGKALWEQGGRTTGVITSATTSGNVMTVRFAVPWSNLGISPAANSVIGLDVGINDDDDGGARDGQAMAFGTGSNWQSTAVWGSVRLQGSSGTGGGGGSNTGGAGGSGGAVAACSGVWNANVGTLGGPPVSRRSDVTVTKFMDLPFSNPTRVIRDPVNGDLLVLRENGELYRLVIATKTLTKIATPTVFGGNSSGGDRPALTSIRTTGLASNASGNTLYLVATRPEEASGFAQDSQAFVYKGTRQSNGTYTFALLFNSALYPRAGGTYYTHEWTGIAVSPDGAYLYINAGSRTDHGEVQSNLGRNPGLRESPLSARILRFPAAIAPGTVIGNTEAAVAPYVFANGIRNSYDPQFAPSGDLLAGDNGPDGDYHEELNWLRQGVHYGFPFRLGNEDNQMALLKGSYVRANDWRVTSDQSNWYADSGYPSPPAGVSLMDPIVNPGPEADQFRASDRTVRRASTQSPPKVMGTFTDHGAPLGLAFDVPANNLCSAFAGKAFIMRFGLSVDTRKKESNGFEQGRDLLLLDLSKATGDWKLASVRQLVANFQHPVDNVMVGNRIYVADYGNGDHAAWNGGRLWEVVLPTGPVAADLVLPQGPVVSGSLVASPPAAASARAVAKVVQGTFSNAASFKAWWDANHLGVEVIFNDNAPASIDSTNLWDDDSIELYIDANGNRGTSYDAFDRQYVITLGKSLWEQQGRTTGVVTTANASGNVLTVRYAIPWSNLGMAASSGLRLGLDVGVNDDDGGGARDGQAMSFGSANNWSDTSSWGTVQLQ